MTPLRLILCCAMLAACAAAATPAAAQTPAPAIGYDDGDGATQDDRIAPGDDWPRADAAASGLDDIVSTERSTLCVAGREAPCADVAPGGRAFRGLGRIAGGYVLVPVLHLHFRG